MRHPVSALIFAAGFGTRMRPLTEDRPKPLIGVAGRTLLDHALGLLEPHGVNIAVNAHYRSEMIAAHLADRPEISVIVERPDILDTGGGLKNAAPVLGGGPVITLNSDAVWIGPDPVDALAKAWRPGEMDALLMLIPRGRASGHAGKGDFAGAPGPLSRGPDAVYGGLQIIETGAVTRIGEKAFSMNRVWDDLIPGGRVHGVLYDGRWTDVGRPDSIALAEQELRGRV